MDFFERLSKLPPYVFKEIGEHKSLACQKGKDIIDFSMGNPDGMTPDSITDKMLSAAQHPGANRYSVPQGLHRLRQAIADWYQMHYDVVIAPNNETIVSLGAKDALAHLALAITNQQDKVIVPEPCYPIHHHGFVIAGAQVIAIPLVTPEQFLSDVIAYASNKKVKAILLNFPSNPAGICIDIGFFESIVDFAIKNKIWLIHDFAYADIYFTEQRPPSILQVPRAKEIAIEIYSLSKSFNMPGWRVGFASGNKVLVSALSRMKSYFDYGLYTPIQIGAIEALTNCQVEAENIRLKYQARRDKLCGGLGQIGWPHYKPEGSMFVWAQIPDEFADYDSMSFAKMLIDKAQIAVSPGIGFGHHCDNYVRFALIENEQRIEQAVFQLKMLFSEAAKEKKLGNG